LNSACELRQGIKKDQGREKEELKNKKAHVKQLKRTFWLLIPSKHLKFELDAVLRVQAPPFLPSILYRFNGRL
jgi:hypothetical protein